MSCSGCEKITVSIPKEKLFKAGRIVKTMKKMLIAIDGSDCSLRPVEYAGGEFSGANDLQIILRHVLRFFKGHYV